MTKPANPDGFSTETFSPPTDYRETSIRDIVDAVAGPEPQAILVYGRNAGRGSGRDFVELQPYEEE